MSKRKPDSISWLFNQADARKAVSILGARNLLEVRACCIDRIDFLETIGTYSKMVQYSSQQADQELIEWMKKMIIQHKNSGDERYIYFKFIR